MDLELASSPLEAQMDWMTIMMQIDNQADQLPRPQSLLTSVESTAPLPEAVYNSIAFPYQGFEPKTVEEMREMVFCMAALQPIHIDPESIKPPKRRNVKISKDPQSVAARLRRERISQRIRILQRLVPGGTKMDTASMLDEAVQYLKFLKNQVRLMQRAAAGQSVPGFIKPTPLLS